MAAKRRAPKVETKSAALTLQSVYFNGFQADRGIPDRNSVAVWYQAWRDNGDVMRAVKIIGDTVAKGGVKVTRNGEDFESPETDALVASFLDWKQEIMMHAIVGGDAFVVKMYNDPEFGGVPVGLKVLDSRLVTVEHDALGNVSKYVAGDRVRTGLQLTYSPDDVYQWTPVTDPDRPLRGYSALGSAIYDALGDDRAALANFVFYDNDATPASILKVKDGVTQDDADKIQDWMRRKYSGAANKSRTAVLQGVEDVIKLGETTDSKFSNLREQATEKVLAALGVPKSVLNYTAGVTYSNAAAQYTAFIENTVRPAENVMARMLTDMVREMDPSLTVTIVDDHIDDRAERQRTAVENVKAGIITPNEARAAMGLPPASDPSMDVFLVTRPAPAQPAA
jgi:HK97 family phage portal protein